MQIQTTEPAAKTAPKAGVDLTNRDLSWFSQRVERGRKEIFSETITITPDIARRLLEQNFSNRRINETTVRAIAHDIKAGHWQLNGESLIVTADGELNDGQNRLTAIVRAGIPVQSVVVFGVTRKSRLTVDMGAARTAAQFLEMQGHPNGVRYSGIAKLQLSFLSKEATHQSRKWTRQDVIAAFHDYNNEIIAAHTAVANTKAANLVGGWVFLPCAYLNIKTVDPINCEIFFEKLGSGANLEPGDPILLLRQRLMEMHQKKPRPRAETRLEAVIRCWNMWAQDKSIKSKVALVGVYPTILRAERRA